jgi:hypothetical protein
VSFFTKLRDVIVGAAKGAARNKSTVVSVVSVVLLAAGVANPELIAPTAANVYCTVVVKCEA